MAEAVLFGRAAMGEAMQEGHWSDRWRVRRGGRLVFAESARLDGAIAGKLAAPAAANGGIALATVLIAPGDDGHARGRARARHSKARPASRPGTASRWRGCVARDGMTLRRDLVALLAALGTPVPRLWLQ